MTPRTGLFKGPLICMMATPMLSAAHAKNFRVLHTFKDTPDGATPSPELLSSGGKFYGTTLDAGAYNDGTAYEMDAKGHITLLY